MNAITVVLCSQNQIKIFDLTFIITVGISCWIDHTMRHIHDIYILYVYI